MIETGEEKALDLGVPFAVRRRLRRMKWVRQRQRLSGKLRCDTRVLRGASSSRSAERS
jgi:hypothetical protein